MGKLKFRSNSADFLKRNESFKDMVKGHMAQDIEVALKTTAGMPVSNTKASGNKRGGGGHMKSETRFFRSPSGGWRVEVDKSYAAYQERGAREDGSHLVRNYSTPGTSKGFFRRAIDMTWRHRTNYIEETRRALNL